MIKLLFTGEKTGTEELRSRPVVAEPGNAVAKIPTRYDDSMLFSVYDLLS